MSLKRKEQLLLIFPTFINSPLEKSYKKAFDKKLSNSLESPAMERRSPVKAFSCEFAYIFRRVYPENTQRRILNPVKHL